MLPTLEYVPVADVGEVFPAVSSNRAVQVPTSESATPVRSVASLHK